MQRATNTATDTLVESLRLTAEALGLDYVAVSKGVDQVYMHDTRSGTWAWVAWHNGVVQCRQVIAIGEPRLAFPDTFARPGEALVAFAKAGLDHRYASGLER